MKTLRRLRNALCNAATAAALCATLLPMSAFAAPPSYPMAGPNPFTAGAAFVGEASGLVVLSAGAVDGVATVAVAPANVAGPGAVAAWYDVAMALSAGRTEPGAALAAASGLSFERTGPFGFAGALTSADLHVLRVGLAVGHALAARGLGDAAGAAAAIKVVRAEGRVLAGLSAETVAAVDDALSSRSGLVALDMVDVFTASARGTAVKDRAHGYFCAGVYAASALYVAARGGSAQFASLAAPLATKLDKDAAADHLDRSVARSMRAIATELGRGRPDVDAVKREVAALLAASAG